MRTLKPISYCRFKYFKVYIFEGFEPDAIPCDARLAERFSIRTAQIFLIFDTHDIDGDPCLVRAQTDLVKLPGRSIGIFHSVKSVPYIRVGNSFAFVVLTVQEP